MQTTYRLLTEYLTSTKIYTRTIMMSGASNDKMNMVSLYINNISTYSYAIYFYISIFSSRNLLLFQSSYRFTLIYIISSLENSQHLLNRSQSADVKKQGVKFMRHSITICFLKNIQFHHKFVRGF